MISNRRYYYLKLKETFFQTEIISVLESMQDGMIYSNLLIKLYLMSLKHNGILMLNDRIPHTSQTIATITKHQIGTVERAMNIFIELGLVEILTNGAYYMTDIQLFIGQSSSEGDRKRKQRMELKAENLLPETVPKRSGQMSDKNPPILEIELEKELELDLEKERELEQGQFSLALGKYKNISLSDDDYKLLQEELPTTYEYYIERLSEYMASTGKTYDNHLATIRLWAKRDNEKNGNKPVNGKRNYDYDCKNSL